MGKPKPYVVNTPPTGAPIFPDVCVVCLEPSSQRRGSKWWVRPRTTQLYAELPYCGEHARMFDEWTAHWEARDAAWRALPPVGQFPSPIESMRRFFLLPVAVLAPVGAVVALVGGETALVGATIGMAVGGLIGLARMKINEAKLLGARKLPELPPPPVPAAESGQPPIEWHGSRDGALACAVGPVTKRREEGMVSSTEMLVSVELTAIQYQFDNHEYGRRFASVNPGA